MQAEIQKMNYELYNLEYNFFCLDDIGEGLLGYYISLPHAEMASVIKYFHRQFQIGHREPRP